MNGGEPAIVRESAVADVLTHHATIARARAGLVPLPVVTARIDRFIGEDGKGPYPDME